MAFLIANAQVWDGENDERYPADVLIENNRIAAVARGRGQIRRDGAEVVDGGGMTLISPRTKPLAR
jgi:dihydroorotase-like cyclic amidohydrolase